MAEHEPQRAGTLTGIHEALAPGVWLVGGPELSDSRDCLIYALDLGALVLIDCGCGPSWPTVAGNLRSAGLDPAALHTLILTHCHIDHAGAAAGIKDALGCRVVAHAGDVPALASGDAERTAADRYGLLMLPVPIDHVVSGPGEQLALPGGTLELLHTPGHTPGSMAAVLRRDGQTLLFGQDVHGPFQEAFASDRAAWRSSMDRLLALRADVLCEGHAGVIRGADAVERFIRHQLAQHA